MTSRTHGDPSGELFVRESGEQYDTQPLTCLGVTFESEDARREYFLERLKG